MKQRPYKVLLVEPSPELVEIFVGLLTERLTAQVTCVAEAKACLDVDIVEPHDLVISELALEDSDGLQLAGHLMSLSARPIILLADDLGTRDVIDALRLGVCDIFEKPFPVEQLLDSAKRALYGYEVKRQHVAKYGRMRELVRRVVRERRDLNRRIELVCRDLVGAHRRLVHRVLATPNAKQEGVA